MKRASVADAKNALNTYLERVKEGETVPITERGVPIECLGPVAASKDPTGRRQRLVRSGLARSGTESLPSSLREAPTTTMPVGESIVDMVLDERAAGDADRRPDRRAAGATRDGG